MTKDRPRTDYRTRYPRNYESRWYEHGSSHDFHDSVELYVDVPFEDDFEILHRVTGVRVANPNV